MLTIEDRRARRRARQESDARVAAAQAEARAAVAARRCPWCGAGLRHNLALTGWVQCEQYGAPGFRARASDPPCDWQGFTR